LLDYNTKLSELRRFAMLRTGWSECVWNLQEPVRTTD